MAGFWQLFTAAVCAQDIDSVAPVVVKAVTPADTVSLTMDAAQGLTVSVAVTNTQSIAEECSLFVAPRLDTPAKLLPGAYAVSWSPWSPLDAARTPEVNYALTMVTRYGIKPPVTRVKPGASAQLQSLSIPRSSTNQNVLVILRHITGAKPVALWVAALPGSSGAEPSPAPKAAPPQR